MNLRTLGTLPTEDTVTRVLDGDLSAVKTAVGWTFFRTLLIFPAVWLAGVEPKRAFIGSFLASTFLTVSAYTYVAALPKSSKDSPP